jgi:hypothetical protein
MKSIQVQYIDKMIKDNQLEYIIDKAIGDNDFNKISLIFTVATNQIYDYGVIREYIYYVYDNND